jgi:hypothetical protein
LYGIHSLSPLSSPLVQTVAVSTWMDVYLTENRTRGGERGRARAPDPDNFWPRGGLGRSESRGTCLPPATMSSLACQNPIKKTLCSLPAQTCQTRCYDVFFSVPVVSNFSRLGEKPSGKPFHPPTRSTDRPTIDTTTPGERQKLITFPLTAEKCHLLIFSSPAVRRQRGQERKQDKIKISYGPVEAPR